MTLIPPGAVGRGRDTDPADLWVFGYGSLMWNPGFAYAEAVRARIDGYRRALCIYSLHYRGTPQRPGLVLGLARGGICDGVAFRVAPEEAARVRAYLHARELIYGVYRETFVTADVTGGEGRRVRALTYVAETGHDNYAGAMAPARQAAIIRGARGKAGTNLAYLMATLGKLRALGLVQRDLELVAEHAGVAGLLRGPGRQDWEPGCRARWQVFARRAACGPGVLRNDRPHGFAFRRGLSH